jgi:hypothetical protein
VGFGGELGGSRAAGMEPSGRAAGLGGSHHSLGNGGCCKVGEPAGALFDATARNDPHEYESRPLRETGRGSSRAVVWGSAPVETEGGTGRASFFRGDTPRSRREGGCLRDPRQLSMLHCAATF